MIGERPLVFGVVVVVVVTALVSGPLVGAVDLTGESSVDSAIVGTGTVEVESVTLPESASLEAGRFGAETLYLRVPDARIELRRVFGQPIVTYRLSIAELGFTRESVHFVTERNEGTLDLSMGQTTLDHDEVSNESYTGELTVNVRNEAGSRTVANGTVAVEVVR